MHPNLDSWTSEAPALYSDRTRCANSTGLTMPSADHRLPGYDKLVRRGVRKDVTVRRIAALQRVAKGRGHTGDYGAPDESSCCGCPTHISTVAITTEDQVYLKLLSGLHSACHKSFDSSWSGGVVMWRFATNIVYPSGKGGDK
jgi:hypothetical protein